MVICLKYDRIKKTEKQKITEICLKCGVCCVVQGYSCPAQYGSKYTPQEIYVYDIFIDEKPTKNPNIWTCVSCHKCEEMCPYEVSPIKYIEESKKQALKNMNAPRQIYDELRLVMNTGYAFPITSNSKRQRRQNKLPEISIIEQIKLIMQKTGLSVLLEEAE